MVVPAVAINEAQVGSDTPDPTLNQPAPKDQCAPFRLRNLGMSFGGVYACRALDLEFHQGEVHAFVGENGAGKSTTMKCLAGLYAPTQGVVEVDGQPVHLTSPRDAERLGICLIPQELDLFPELSIAENMFLGRDRPHTRWGGFDGEKMKAVARAALDRMGLNLDPRKKVKHLSAANAKIVEIARALTRQARLLIMDEPTASLTEREVARLFQVVRDLRAQGITIIYISHRLDEVFALSDRITVLRDGRHVSTGKTSAFTPSSLVQMMVGSPARSLVHPHLPASRAGCAQRAGPRSIGPLQGCQFRSASGRDPGFFGPYRSGQNRSCPRALRHRAGRSGTCDDRGPARAGGAALDALWSSVLGICPRSVVRRRWCCHAQSRGTSVSLA